MKVGTLRLVTLIGVVIVFVCLVANTGVAIYFIASASAEALNNPPLLIAVVSMGLAVAVGWGSLILVVGLFHASRTGTRNGSTKALSSR